MARESLISGALFGKVDWLSADGLEAGMYMKTSDRPDSRVVLGGTQIQSLIKNQAIQKGMMVTAHGGVTARCFQRRDDKSDVGELLLNAQKVVVEAPREGRLRSTIYSYLKGVIMYWDPGMLQAKVFFNYTEPGLPKQMTCSLNLKQWMRNMTPEGQQRFLDGVRVGREFIASSLTEVACYRNAKGELVPALMLSPTHFQLQG